MGYVDLSSYVRRAATQRELVVQPRMGMASPEEMRAGLLAVRDLPAWTAGTITLDSYTRVGDLVGARSALDQGSALNGYPLLSHGARVAASVAGAVAEDIPVQVRHGSSDPRAIFATMAAAGLFCSEGGPVSYCLPYGRTPLPVAVAAWAEGSEELAAAARAAGEVAHLETFGGCLLGQMCPPSLLVAISVLEALFFAQHGVGSVSLSYAQQTSHEQDVEALRALATLAAELLPSGVTRHVVLYTYMGVYPTTARGARRLLARSAALAVAGGAQRLIVKTEVEAVRIPSVEDNLRALTLAAEAGRAAYAERGADVAPGGSSTGILEEARTLVLATLSESSSIGEALERAFAKGLLDVPFCLHADNAGQTRSAIADDGRIEWVRTGRMPIAPTRRATARGVTSTGLLEMLQQTARHEDDHGRASVAIVGGGPRGLSVLERLAARLAQEVPEQGLDIHLLDDVAVGSGRIWRPDQSGLLLMNTVAGEVTMFSGPADDGPARAGAGPSLADWWRDVDPERAGPDAFASRALYGRYLGFVLDSVEAGLPDGVRLHRRQTRVLGMRRHGEQWRLQCADGEELAADRVALCTGHPRPAPSPDAGLVPADSAADLDLGGIGAGDVVGVRGLGLTFYDTLALLTEGRGGRYVDDGTTLRYLPSGNEPLIVAGSRSGVPLRARGVNQKPAVHAYRPRVFTAERVAALRRGPAASFRGDVLPWVLAEIMVVRAEAELRRRLGRPVALCTPEELAAVNGDPDPCRAVGEIARRHGLTSEVPELEAMAQPFRGRSFASPQEYTSALVELVTEDLALSAEGNADGPVKAGLDVLRDVRQLIRDAVDHGGLTAAAHEEEFVRWFEPLVSALAAGPPRDRLRQLLALVDSGVVRLLGPGFTVERTAEGLVASSPAVAGSRTRIDVLLDARIPGPDLRTSRDPLHQGLAGAGVLTSWVNRSGGDYVTGSVAVTGSPFHPVDAAGEAVRSLYVLGIPTEGCRWFMQVGSGRPGPWGSFARDADAIAGDMLDGVRAPSVEPAAERYDERVAL